MDNATLIGSGAGLGLASLKMVGALCLVLALLFLGLALLKRFGLAAKLQGASGGYLKIEERIALGPRKQLVVVRFLNKLLVLGVTDSGINLITEANHDSQTDFTKILERAQHTDTADD